MEENTTTSQNQIQNQNEECLELKNIKYKTMLLNGNPLKETKSSNDISNLELLEKDKQEPISGKPAEYLLHSFNKESVLNEVFRSDQELKEQKPNAEKLVAQLPQSIS